MLNDILSVKNLLSVLISGEGDFGLIVSQQLLNNYHYSLNDRFIYIGFKDSMAIREMYERIPVPVRDNCALYPSEKICSSITIYFKKR